MRERPTVLVTAPLPDDLRDLVAARTDMVATTADALAAPDEALAQRMKEAVGLLTTIRVKIDDDFLDRCPKLKVVSNFAVGFDNVDLEVVQRRQVMICNTPGVLDAAVADIATVMLLCLGRRIFQNDRFVREGSWAKGPAPYSLDIAGKTLGLLGMGRIGRLVAERARAFGLKVAYYKPNRDGEAEAAGLANYLERDALFAESDFLSVHCPLTPKTRGSIGAREFALMKKSAFFVNTARGGIVDEAALIAVLREGRIAGAGLDVMVKEPIPGDHPLCSLPNVILQPHIGSATHETRRAMIELAVRNVLAAVEGRQPEAVVDTAKAA
ncbi:MAG: D-glycerate dehydrogenase [Tistlia sp.]|uniref:2-hydroxyacid dehydrogenase n=1 Tax=Tistlia sp. TaxID=3057121 RepID=UPI0034A5CCAE